MKLLFHNFSIFLIFFLRPEFQNDGTKNLKQQQQQKSRKRMKENFFQKFNTTNEKQRFLYNEKIRS